MILAGEEERFWRYLARAISQNQKHGLIYKLPFRTHLPLTFDVDLVHETPVEISDERLNALVLAITESVCVVTGVDSGLEVFALRKPEPTQSHQVWKNGCHVIIHGARVTTAIARKIRQHFMDLEIVHDFIEEFGVTKPDEMLDDRVSPLGANGLIMAPQTKPGRKVGYHCFSTFKIHQRDIQDPQNFTPEEGRAFVLEHLSKIYNFVFRDPEWTRIGEYKEPKKKQDVQISDRPVFIDDDTPPDDVFDLQKFLSVTAGHVPNRKEWIQILAYLIHINYPMKAACALMNRAWCPSDLNENETTWKQLVETPTDNPVTGASIVRYIGLYGKNYKISEILKTVTEGAVYWSQVNDLLKNTTLMLAEVERLVSNVFVYIHRNDSFMWKYHVVEMDRNKRKRTKVCHQIKKRCAGTKSESFYVQIRNTKRELESKLKRFAKSNKSAVEAVGAALGKIDDLSLQEFTEEAEKIMGYVAPVEMTTEYIFAEMQKKCMFKRYMEINFMPYLGNVDPLPESVLNTFSGFPLETYVPEKPVDVEDTLIWRYLCVVFGWSKDGTYNDRVGELLDRVAYKLQNCAQRSQKIHVIFSRIQGIGKSLFYNFLAMIFGEEMSQFHTDLTSYLSKFNMHNSSMMVHFVDDIQGASAKQTRDIFPRVTEKSHLYESKGENVVRMNEYSELWISGNDKAASLYVSSEDRRIVIYEACPALKHETTFWRNLIAEFQDFDICKAWYEYLKSRDVSEFHPDKVHEASAKLKMASIADSMCKVHIFLERFFSSEKWHVMFFNNKLHNGPEWFADVQITVRRRKPRVGQKLIRTTQEWLYKNYAQWLRQYYNSSRILGMQTFLNKVEEVGICVPKRKQRIHKSTARVIDLYYTEFERAYHEKYGSEVNVWATEDPEQLAKIQRVIERYISNAE